MRWPYQPPNMTCRERVADTFWLVVFCVMALVGAFQVPNARQGR